MNTGTFNGGVSVNEASPAASKLFASIPSDKGTPDTDDDEGGEGGSDDEDQEEDQEKGGQGGQESEEDDKGEQGKGKSTSTKGPNKEEDDEEDAEEEDEEEGEDSELIQNLFKEFGEVELENTNFETEAEAVTAVVKGIGVKEYNKGKEEGVSELFEYFPEVKALAEHLNAGYTIESFLQEVQVPDYSRINLEEATDEQKENLYRTYLKEKDTDEDEIESLVETVKDAGKMDERADKAKTFLTKKYQEQVDKKKAEEKTQKEAREKQAKEQEEKLNAIFKTGDLKVAKLNETQSKQLKEFISNNELYQKTWAELPLEKRLLIEHLVSTDFKDLGLGKGNGASTATTKSIKIKGSKNNGNPLSNSSSNSSGGIDIKKLFNKS